MNDTHVQNLVPWFFQSEIMIYLMCFYFICPFVYLEFKTAYELSFFSGKLRSMNYTVYVYNLVIYCRVKNTTRKENAMKHAV